MNWLGELIQKEIEKETDTVLDFGCGIFQATTNSLLRSKANPHLKHRLFPNNEQKNLKCKSLLGCEIVDKYIDVAKLYFPVIKFDMTNIDNYMMFADNSYDIVMAIDVLEHIEFSHAHKIIVQMQRIARKKVIIYTPSKFELNEKNIENAWGLGKNPNQEHKSFINSDYLHNVMGFQRITFPKPDKNTLAIWEKKK